MSGEFSHEELEFFGEVRQVLKARLHNEIELAVYGGPVVDSETMLTLIRGEVRAELQLLHEMYPEGIAS